MTRFAFQLALHYSFWRNTIWLTGCEMLRKRGTCIENCSSFMTCFECSSREISRLCLVHWRELEYKRSLFKEDYNILIKSGDWLSNRYERLVSYFVASKPSNMSSLFLEIKKDSKCLQLIGQYDCMHDTSSINFNLMDDLILFIFIYTHILIWAQTSASLSWIKLEVSPYLFRCDNPPWKTLCTYSQIPFLNDITIQLLYD